MLQRPLSSTLRRESAPTDPSEDETRFEESLKALGGSGDRRDPVGSLGAAGLGLVAAPGLSEAEAKGSKPSQGKSANGTPGGKQSNDRQGQEHGPAVRQQGQERAGSCVRSKCAEAGNGHPMSLCLLAGKAAAWLSERLGRLHAAQHRRQGVKRFRALIEHSLEMVCVADAD